ncbi:hypothetical protein VPH35_033712 [Triticum aestivum]
MADNGKAKLGSGAAYTTNLETFSKRLKVFYDHWNENKSHLWASSDAIAIVTPPPSEDLRHLKSTALDVWLLGYDEFPETIIVFMQKQIHFLCSEKKANLIGTIKDATASEAVGSDIVLHVKSKNGDGIDLMDDNTAEKLSGGSVQLADVTRGFSEIFAMKDATEIICVEKAACLTSYVMKNFVVPTMEKVIEEERKVSHFSLMDDTEKVILDPSKAKVKLKPENIDICYPPIFQSGGKNAPELLPNLTKSAGTGIGLEFRESGLNLTAKNDRLIKEGMTFNVNLGLSNHQAELARQKNEETATSLAGGGSGSGDGRGPSRSSNELRELVIQVDQRNEVVLLPIYGSMVPSMFLLLKTSRERNDYPPSFPFVQSYHGFGNKKTKDVQFYVEVMDVVQTVGGTRRSALDLDEIEEEQRERDWKNRINIELGFHGVLYKASVFIIPTSTCLVELIETPFSRIEMVTLGDIEIVNLERVGFGTKNFDMAIVFKDFKKDEWIDTTDLKYYESRLYLNWHPILKTIINDQKFVDDGGWEFLNMEANQGYEPSAAEPESESEDEDSDNASLVESDEDEEED